MPGLAKGSCILILLTFSDLVWALLLLREGLGEVDERQEDFCRLASQGDEILCLHPTCLASRNS